jgi:hypothetical protein
MLAACMSDSQKLTVRPKRALNKRGSRTLTSRLDVARVVQLTLGDDRFAIHARADSAR